MTNSKSIQMFIQGLWIPRLFKGHRTRALVTVFLLAAASGFAQTDPTERIKALEQALADIKSDAATVQDESARTKTLERVKALEADLGKVKADKAAGRDVTATLDTLEQQITALKGAPASGMQGAPNPLQDDKKFLTGQDLLDESFPNSIPIPGSDFRLRIGGYAKLDFIQDLDYVGDRFEFELATIPVEGSDLAAFDGRTTAHAKETRINFDFRGRASNESRGWNFPLQIFLEFDFFEDSEALFRQPRLRHAYGVIGRLLAGQTWSTSGDLEALAGTIDFSGGDALYGDRVAQVRWQDRFNKHVTYALAIEEPKTAIGNPLGLDGLDRPKLPNFAGHMRFTSTGGSHVQFGADFFQLTWQGGATDPHDSAFGYGLNFTGRLLLAKNGRNALVAGGTIGEGSAHRVIVLEAGANDAVITPDGLDVISHWQAYAGYSHYWTGSLNSTLTAGWAGLNNSDFQPGSAIHQGRSVHANLIWFPYPTVSTGFEVMWGERENKDGAKGDAVRFQYMAKFKFN